MTVYEDLIAKLSQLPEPLAQEVSDFIDFLLLKEDKGRWRMWTQFHEATDLAEADFSDYLANLESYEERLAHGEVQW